MGKKIVLCNCSGERISKDRLHSIEQELVKSGVEVIKISDLCRMSALHKERLCEVFKNDAEYQVIGCYSRTMKLLLDQAEPAIHNDQIEYINFLESSNEEISEIVKGNAAAATQGSSEGSGTATNSESSTTPASSEGSATSATPVSDNTLATAKTPALDSTQATSATPATDSTLATSTTPATENTLTTAKTPASDITLATSATPAPSESSPTAATPASILTPNPPATDDIPPGTVEEITMESDWPSWYPVIDYARCTACGQCADFCLFGVYEKTPERVTVTNPQGCKYNCPACGRICPQTAIIFPKYKAGGAIGGSEFIDEISEQKRQTEDINSILGGDIYQALEKRKMKRRSIIRDEEMNRAIEERMKALNELKKE